MRPLSGMDNLFLEMEHGNQYMHVAGLGIYDQTTAPGGSVRFKQILEFFSQRIKKEKIFRSRLVVPPLNIDRPYWVEDGEIDVEYHVRHIALPAPGDWRQLMILIARIHSRPLERTKPLWEAYVIEGLDNITGIAKGSFAFYIKFHHAAVDGEAGARIVETIHSLTNQPDAPATGTHVVYADREPSTIELFSRAVLNRGSQLLDAGKLIASLGGKAAKAGVDLAASGKLLEMAESLASKATAGGGSGGGGGANPLTAGIKRKPHTRFDEMVSPHRVVGATGFSLADCKTIREHVADITINDIFLASCGGAVRRYLESKGELPAETLSALMPISTRSKHGGGDAGNQVGMVPVPLRTDIADPIERVRGAKRGARTSKGASSVLGHDFAGKLIQVIPAMAAEGLINQGMVPMCNTTVSNVRGPNVPLYLAGAKLQVFLPVSIAFNGIGLNMTGFSYNGILWVCFVSCRKMLPDPKFFRGCLNASFAEILAAAKKLPLVEDDSAASGSKSKPAAKPGTRRPAAAKAAAKAAPEAKTKAKPATRRRTTSGGA